MRHLLPWITAGRLVSNLTICGNKDLLFLRCRHHRFWGSWRRKFNDQPPLMFDKEASGGYFTSNRGKVAHMRML
jgi:hypothetical protein